MSVDTLREVIGIEEYEDLEQIDAASFEKQIAERLAKIGEVQRQVRVENRGDGRAGRIDLVLMTDEEAVPIEIDRMTPRAKSIFKVRSFNPDSAFVITRSPFRVLQV